jgi:hypothetical protein
VTAGRLVLWLLVVVVVVTVDYLEMVTAVVLSLVYSLVLCLVG